MSDDCILCDRNREQLAKRGEALLAFPGFLGKPISGCLRPSYATLATSRRAVTVQSQETWLHLDTSRELVHTQYAARPSVPAALHRILYRPSCQLDVVLHPWNSLSNIIPEKREQLFSIDLFVFFEPIFSLYFAFSCIFSPLFYLIFPPSSLTVVAISAMVAFLHSFSVYTISSSHSLPVSTISCR